MVITRTPFRISFFGGGTDFPEWYQIHGGEVLSTTIDKYSYVMVRRVEGLASNKYRIRYSRIENVNNIDDIQHPSVRECLRFLHIDEPLTITHDGDLPARSGIGSSSGFTVGLLKGLYVLRDEPVRPYNLAMRAIHVERDLIGETVGCQDQVATAVGGLNHIIFGDRIETERVILSRENRKIFERCLLFLYTGTQREAQTIEKKKIANLGQRGAVLAEMQAFVKLGLSALLSGDYREFGRLLDHNWSLKRSLAREVSNDTINYVYGTAMNNGMIGGKICGAGGGGFFLCFAEPDAHERIKRALPSMKSVPIRLEDSGSKVIYRR